MVLFTFETMRTETKIRQMKTKRNNKIMALWESFYEHGVTQKTALAADIAEKLGVSASTVNRVVEPFMKHLKKEKEKK